MPSNSADVTQTINSKDGSLHAGGNPIRQLSSAELVGDRLAQVIDPAMILTLRE